MIAVADGAGASGDLQWTVVVAVIAVRMVQMTVDQVIDVVAVRHRFMPAARPLHMTGAMAGTVVLRRAAVRVGGVQPSGLAALTAITCSSTWSPCM